MAKIQSASAIPAVLKMCREMAGLSQEYMAKKCGCSQSMIAKVESGERELTVSMLQVYAEETGEPWLKLITASDVIIEIVQDNIRTKQRLLAMLQGA